MLKKTIVLFAMAAVLTGCLHKSPETPNIASEPPFVTTKRMISTVEPQTLQASSTAAIRLFVNGNQAAAAPKLISGATYVPVRAAGE